MSNSFNISVKPEIAAVKTVVDANAVILADVHDTDLPLVKSAVDVNTSKLNSIINVKLPEIITEINANETKIDANLTAIQLIQQAQFFSIAASDDLLASSDSEKHTASTSYTLAKEFIVRLPGIYRISFELKSLDGLNASFGKIYKNGVAHGPEHTTASTTYVSYTDDLLFNGYDLIQLYYYYAVASDKCYVQNYRIYGTLSLTKAFVTLD